MEKVYFNPGCALSIYRPGAESKIMRYLNQYYGQVTLHKICCQHNPQVEENSLIINVCAGCDRRFRSLYDGVSTTSLWEVIDQTGHFEFPDYSDAEMSVHDPCPIREKPSVHQAVRSLLQKMNVKITEAEEHGSRSVCCGDSLYPQTPLEAVHKHMKKSAAAMPCEQVAVYCVSCIKSMHIGGKTPRHMIDLLLSETTTPETYDTVAWHEQLQEYIDVH